MSWGNEDRPSSRSFRRSRSGLQPHQYWGRCFMRPWEKARQAPNGRRSTRSTIYLLHGYVADNKVKNWGENQLSQRSWICMVRLSWMADISMAPRAHKHQVFSLCISVQVNAKKKKKKVRVHEVGQILTEWEDVVFTSCSVPQASQLCLSIKPHD